MKNSIIIKLFVICFLLSGICNAQSQFQRTIGADGSDAAQSMIRTTDGGYALAGHDGSLENMYIVKLDSNGTLQWSRTISDSQAHSIIQTTDGGYVVGGYTSSYGAGNVDFFIVKLDSNGTLQWSRTVGGIYFDNFYSIIQTADGGYAAAGYSFSFGAEGIYVVKLNGSGMLKWSRTIGGSDYEYAYAIIQTTDGGYAVAGETESFGAGNTDMYLVKLDSSGMLQWSRTVGGTSFEHAYSIVQTTDGSYVMAGTTNTFGAGTYDVYIAKLDASGTLLWCRTIGGSGFDRAYSVIQTADGGYAAAGWTGSFGAVGEDFYIIKLDSSGTLQWSRRSGGAGYDNLHSIVQTPDGGYAAAGFTNSFGAGSFDMYIVKLDAGGNTCGNFFSPSSISGTGGYTSSPISTVTSPTSIVTSPTPSTGTGGTVTSICTLAGIQPVLNLSPNAYQIEQNYPNPFNPTTKIKFALLKRSFAELVVYDMLGKEVTSLVNEQLNPGTYEVEWDASGYSSGVYFYKLISGDYVNSKKMILMK